MAQKDTRTPVFIAALFTTAETGKQAKYPLTGMDREDVVYIYAHTYIHTQWNTPQSLKRMK